ncbi:MAG: undecaprenyl-diphosphate phosphatase [Micavibrio sp.]|nr:undecaprenyl-diphosphate phosphatase [Micavibrio sp.]
MGLLPIIILALVQGITEFLPVSSSGHLVLVHAFLGGGEAWAERIVMDVSVHVGTLFAVLLYFRNDVKAMICGFLGWFKGDLKSAGGSLAVSIALASIPVLVAGLVLHLFKPAWLDRVEVMAWATIVFGIVLWVADRRPQKINSLDGMSFVHALIIGAAQALALIPGTSRSGITMSAARFLGYSRAEAARFSLLLAIIAISGAGALAGIELAESGDARLGFDALLAGFIAFITAWVAIAAMMKWLEKASFTVFAVYRLILGAALLVAIYSGFLQL